MTKKKPVKSNKPKKRPPLLSAKQEAEINRIFKLAGLHNQATASYKRARFKEPSILKPQPHGIEIKKWN